MGVARLWQEVGGVIVERVRRDRRHFHSCVFDGLPQTGSYWCQSPKGVRKVNDDPYPQYYYIAGWHFREFLWNLTSKKIWPKIRMYLWYQIYLRYQDEFYCAPDLLWFWSISSYSRLEEWCWSPPRLPFLISLFSQSLGLRIYRECRWHRSL